VIIAAALVFLVIAVGVGGFFVIKVAKSLDGGPQVAFVVIVILAAGYVATGMIQAGISAWQIGREIRQSQGR
jgi:hypothetical protein